MIDVVVVVLMSVDVLISRCKLAKHSANSRRKPHPGRHPLSYRMSRLPPTSLVTSRTWIRLRKKTHRMNYLCRGSEDYASAGNTDGDNSGSANCEGRGYSTTTNLDAM
jgi:hypothetical protein